MTVEMITIEALIILTIGYFLIGVTWAIHMHRQLKHFPRAKWIVFIFNLNMWPECMAIWIWLQIYRFIKANRS